MDCTINVARRRLSGERVAVPTINVVRDIGAEHLQRQQIRQVLRLRHKLLSAWFSNSYPLNYPSLLQQGSND